MVQGDLAGLVLGNGAATRLAGRGGGGGIDAGRGLGAGAGAGGRVVLWSADDDAGDGIDVVLITLAIGGKVDGVEVGAVLPIQPGGGEGGSGFRHARRLQGDGLGRVQSDILRLAAGLATAGRSEDEQGRPAQDGEQSLLDVHGGRSSFLLIGSSLPGEHEGNMKPGKLYADLRENVC